MLTRRRDHTEICIAKNKLCSVSAEAKNKLLTSVEVAPLFSASDGKNGGMRDINAPHDT